MTDDWRLGTHDSRPALRRDAKALYQNAEDSSLTLLTLLRAGPHVVALLRPGTALRSE
jgi:hypothetical protein